MPSNSQEIGSLIETNLTYRKKYDNIQLVNVDNIPKDIIDTPIDDLIELYQVCCQMQKICEKEQGIGLAAAQIGIPWRLFIVKADEYSPFDPPGQFGYFINCDYASVLENYILSITIYQQKMPLPIKERGIDNISR